MTLARMLHVGTVGEAPVRFYERNVPFAECPRPALIDIFRALALPQDRDAAVITSMSRDYIGGILQADDGTVLITPPIAGKVVKAVRIFGKDFDPQAWCLKFAAASNSSLERILERLPPEHRSL